MYECGEIFPTRKVWSLGLGVSIDLCITTTDGCSHWMTDLFSSLGEKPTGSTLLFRRQFGSITWTIADSLAFQYNINERNENLRLATVSFLPGFQRASFTYLFNSLPQLGNTLTQSFSSFQLKSKTKLERAWHMGRAEWFQKRLLARGTVPERTEEVRCAFFFSLCCV